MGKFEIKIPIIRGQGVSCPEIRNEVVSYIADRIWPGTVFDLGCGVGVFGTALRRLDPQIKMIGLDPTILYLLQPMVLTNYVIRIHASAEDVCEGLISLEDYDLTICMDVIEHLEKRDARKLLSYLLCHGSRRTIVGTPLFEYKQGAVGGNEYETHRCWFTEKELNDLEFETLFIEHHKALDGQEGPMGAFECLR